MDRKQELINAEEQSFDELHDLIAGLSDEQMDLPGANDDDWSIKDVLWHLGCWTAEAANAIEQIRLGTYVETDYDTDQRNLAWFEQGQALDMATVRAEWLSARQRCLLEWSALEEITPAAEEWFFEIGPEHVEDHIGDLRTWVAQLS